MKMTKTVPGTKPLMELDLDSFIHSDSDDDSDSVPHRTIDEILNTSDSSTSSSPPPSPSSIHHPHRLHSDIFPSKTGSLLLQHDVVSQEPAQSLKSQPSSFTGVIDPSRRVASSSSSSRQLPALFTGVRSNAKPGAALAAAVAASRSVPTPHAAAIKSRRAGSGTVQKVLDAQELGRNAGDDHEISSSTWDSTGVITEGSRSVADYQMGDFQSITGEFSSGNVVLEGKRGSGEDFVSLDKEAEVEEVRTSNIWDDSLVGTCESRSSSKFETVVTSVYHSLDVDDSMLDSRVISSRNVNNEKVSLASCSEISTCLDLNDSDRMSASSSPSDAKDRNIEENLTMAELDRGNLDKGMIDHKNDEIGDDGRGDADDDNDNGSSMSDISEIVEERLEQLESERTSKRAEKKFQASKKPLELAEELEKKQASTGLHWEEGAAAQPMRLEGVRRGSTTLGYFDIDTDNTITQTISSQAFRRDHGSPQVLTVHLNYIALGMSKGVIVVVPSKYSTHSADNMESKMLFLGLQAERCYAPVTSMCFNQQGDLLLAGYGDGHITVWDVQRVSAAKVITGEHKAPVVHTLFLGQDLLISRQFKAVTGDSKGLVLLHAFSVVPLLNRFSIKTQCLLDGQRTGIVLSASPLLLDESCGGALSSSQGNSAVSSGSIGGMMGGVVGGDAGWKLFNEGSSLHEGVVIFVTYQTALVVRLSPTLEVYAQLSRPEGVREGSMPCTAWKCVMQSCASSTENTSTEAAERVSLLAIAWDRKVQVAKLVKSELKVYGKWSIDSAAIGVAWLDDQLLVVLTLIGHLYFFAKDGTMIHQTNFCVNGSAGDDLVAYHTYFTNVFGNPEKAYHNCIAVRGASIYILGNMHLVVSRLLPWKERIHVLRKAGDWMGALNMAMTLYDGQAHGVIDLPRALGDAQEAIMPHLVELLLSYVDEVFSYISVAFCNQIEKVEQLDEPISRSSSVHSEIKEQYIRVGGVAVEFCVHIKRTDILFDEIFSRFLAVQQRDTFLELLEPYILKDMLGSLPPEIMQALVEHYSSKGWLQRVEQCVLHMDISSLDFNQTINKISDKVVSEPTVSGDEDASVVAQTSAKGITIVVEAVKSLSIEVPTANKGETISTESSNMLTVEESVNKVD